MDNNAENQLPEKFINELANVPSVPQHLYAGIRRRIDRKRTLVRAIWAVAASLLITVTAFQAAHMMRPENASVAEAAEELSVVNSYINSNVYKEDDNSYGYYEETLYQE